ncbi:hypothetical protein [Actinoplanes aureus]|uniref:BcpO-related WXXGXW repeat protein n=1 Tax=Actinoplanes aureus TaxID=2792083 RepID=A0A931CA59_9ACTN|nr:hypothetical protein [Actinoplanes aureus]MBG0562353.1 hypothetical protein [Actinoplanes aureus]
MNKAIRSLAIAGMSLAAGAMIGVGPVHAAPATDQAAGSNAGYHAQSWADYDYVVGYFRWQRSCRNAGWTGIKYGAWDKYKCSPVRVSWRGWAWKLQVRQEYWNWDDWDGGWPGDWPYKPDYVGSPFNIGQPYKHNGFPWKNYKGNKFDHWKDAPGDKYQDWKYPQGPNDKYQGQYPQGPHDKYQDQYPQGPHDKYQDQDWKYPQGQHDKVKDWKGMP